MARQASRARGYVGGAAISRSISPSSGKRPSRCFEKTTVPSATTSYWLFAPSIAAASCPLALSSAARLAARRS